MEHLYNEVAPKTSEAEAIKVVSEPVKTNLTKPCRYGSSCSRPDCKFSHPEADNSSTDPVKVDIGAKCASLGVSCKF